MAFSFKCWWCVSSVHERVVPTPWKPLSQWVLICSLNRKAKVWLKRLNSLLFFYFLWLFLQVRYQKPILNIVILCKFIFKHEIKHGRSNLHWEDSVICWNDFIAKSEDLGLSTNHGCCFFSFVTFGKSPKLCEPQLLHLSNDDHDTYCTNLFISKKRKEESLWLNCHSDVGQSFIFNFMVNWFAIQFGSQYAMITKYLRKLMKPVINSINTAYYFFQL